jgi:putative membrane protein
MRGFFIFNRFGRISWHNFFKSQTMMSETNKDLILREKLAIQRTRMANQTTFLSFLRTSMYFIVAGLSMKNLFKVDHSVTYETLFYIIGFIMLLIGIINYFRQAKKIKQSEIHIGNYKREYFSEE